MRENLALLIVESRTLISYIAVGLCAMVMALLLSRTRLFRLPNYTWGDSAFDDDRLGPYHWSVWPRPLPALLPFPMLILWLALLVARGGNNSGLWPTLHWLLPISALGLSIGIGWYTAVKPQQRLGMVYFQSCMLLLSAAASAVIGSIRYILLGPQPWTAIALAGALAAWSALLLAFIKTRYFDRAPWDWLAARPGTGSNRAGFLRMFAISHCVAIAAIIIGVYASQSAVGQISWADFGILYTLALCKQQLPAMPPLPLRWITIGIAALSIGVLLLVILLVRQTRTNSLIASGNFHANEYPRRPLLAILLLLTGSSNLVLVFFYLTLAWQVRPYLQIEEPLRRDFAQHWRDNFAADQPLPFHFTAPDGTNVTVSGSLSATVRANLDVIVIFDELTTLTGNRSARAPVVFHPEHADAWSAIADRIGRHNGHPLAVLADAATGAADRQLPQLLILTEPEHAQAMIRNLYTYLQHQASGLSAPQGYAYLQDSGWILPYMPHRAAEMPARLDDALSAYASAKVLAHLAAAQNHDLGIEPQLTTTAAIWTNFLVSAQLPADSGKAFAQSLPVQLSADLQRLQQAPTQLAALAPWLHLVGEVHNRLAQPDAWQQLRPAATALPPVAAWQQYNRQLIDQYARNLHQHLAHRFQQYYNQAQWSENLTAMLQLASEDQAYLQAATSTLAEIYEQAAAIRQQQQQPNFPITTAELQQAANVLEQLFEQQLNLITITTDADQLRLHLYNCDLLLAVIQGSSALPPPRRQHLSARVSNIAMTLVETSKQRNKPNWADHSDSLRHKQHNLHQLRIFCQQTQTLSPLDKKRFEDELTVLEFAIQYEQLNHELTRHPEKSVEALWNGFQTLLQQRPDAQNIISEQLPLFSAVTAFLLVAYPQTEQELKQAAMQAMRELIPTLSTRPLASGRAISARTALILAIVANADYEQLSPEGQLEHVKYFNFHNDLAQLPLFNAGAGLDEAWCRQANLLWNRSALFLLHNWNNYRRSFLNGDIHIGFQRRDGYRRDGVLALLSKTLSRDTEHSQLIGIIDQAPPEELMRFFRQIGFR